MEPKDTYTLPDKVFLQRLEELEKSELLEYRDKFREFSHQFQCRSPILLSKAQKAELSVVSKKLHFIKKECERRILEEKLEKNKLLLLESPLNALSMDDVEFRETLKYMNTDIFEDYLNTFEHKFRKILRSRKEIFQNTGSMSLTELREKLTIIRRWDSIEANLNQMKTKL